MKITNKIKKLVSQLDMPKYRKAYDAFKAEGTKCVTDTIDAFEVKFVVATPAWMEAHGDVIESTVEVYEANGGEMKEISSLTNAPEVIAVYGKPKNELKVGELASQLVIALDTIQDPGNLGTIVRVADWFGVKNILCSYETVDIYNPKAVMATMGAISRVKVHYCNLKDVLEELSDNTAIYSTLLDGENVFSAELTSTGVIVMGNEGKGVSKEVEKCCNRALTIPSYPIGETTSESLNVAMATGIVVSQFRSRLLK